MHAGFDVHKQKKSGQNFDLLERFTYHTAFYTVNISQADFNAAEFVQLCGHLLSHENYSLQTHHYIQRTNYHNVNTASCPSFHETRITDSRWQPIKRPTPTISVCGLRGFAM